MVETLTPRPQTSIANATLVSPTDAQGCPVDWDPNAPAPVVVLDDERGRFELRPGDLTKQQLVTAAASRRPADWDASRNVITDGIVDMLTDSAQPALPDPQRRVVVAPLPRVHANGSVVPVPASPQRAVVAFSAIPTVVEPIMNKEAFTPTVDRTPRQRVRLCDSNGTEIEACYHEISRQDNLLILKFDTAAEGYPRVFPRPEQRYALQLLNVGSTEAYMTRVLIQLQLGWRDDVIDVCILLIDNVVPISEA